MHSLKPGPPRAVIIYASNFSESPPQMAALIAAVRTVLLVSVSVVKAKADERDKSLCFSNSIKLRLEPTITSLGDFNKAVLMTLSTY